MADMDFLARGNGQSGSIHEVWSRSFFGLLDTVPLKIFIKDCHSTYISCNQSYARDLNIQPSEIKGKTDFDFYPTELAQRYRDDDAKVVTGNQSIDVTEPFVMDDLKLWIHTSKFPWHDEKGNIGGVIGVFRDVTEQFEINIKLERKSKLYQVLSHANAAILFEQESDQMLARICEVVLELGGFNLAWMGQETLDNRVKPIVISGEAAEYVRGIEIATRKEMIGGQGPTGTAIRENRVIVVNDFLASSMTNLWHEVASKYCLMGSISLPVVASNFRGALVVYADAVDYFDDDIVELLTNLSNNISFALEQIYLNQITKAQSAQLKLANEVFESGAQAMVVTDVDNNIIRVNQAFCDNTGYRPEEVIGQNPRILKSDKQDRNFYTVLWKCLLIDGTWQGEIWNRRKNGEIYPEWSSINVVRDAQGNITNYFAVFTDMLQKKAVDELDHLKHFDPLTDLPNRSLLEDRIEIAISNAKRRARYVGVMFLNLDHFHEVNDSFGHLIGDQLLIATAVRLVDVAPKSATVTRLSADTFVIALPDLNTSEEINQIADSVLRSLYYPFELNQESIHISAVMGIAVYPFDGAETKELLKSADLALLDTRKSGLKNVYRFYAPKMNEHARHLMEMSVELRSAMAQGRLILHYQPQVDIVSGQIIGAEALIRISHPDRGLISPGDFISVAEETGLIVPIGEWVLREACEQLKRWQIESGSKLMMAVNISPVQLHQANFIEKINEILQATGLEAQYLEIEFTESALMHNVSETVSIMRLLKDIGLHLSIDDFGTGYSSLSYLKQFPVDKLKIDKSFVSNISQNPNDAAIVQAIVALARTLGMMTIAEGVETEAQLGYLRSVHCQEMQGFLFSRPLPPDQFLALLKRGHSFVKDGVDRVLLLVDDEENVLMSLKRILRREGYLILTASDGEEALKLMAENEVSVLLSDQRMPGMSGVELLRRVKVMHPKVVRMILSGYTDVTTLTEAINQGEIYQFITKPWENESLVAQIREAFVRYEMLKSSEIG
jgi:diguanylate cyclase (GGDEF)-like protein/PAS domain S-box-containing protein